MVLSGPVCKLVRGVRETGVRGVEIVIDPPRLEAVASMPVAGEQTLVEAWCKRK